MENQEVAGEETAEDKRQFEAEEDEQGSYYSEEDEQGSIVSGEGSYYSGEDEQGSGSHYSEGEGSGLHCSPNGSPGASEYSRSPGASEYSRSPGASEYSRSPDASEYSRSPGASEYSRSPGASEYSQSPSKAISPPSKSGASKEDSLELSNALDGSAGSAEEKIGSQNHPPIYEKSLSLSQAFSQRSEESESASGSYSDEEGQSYSGSGDDDYSDEEKSQYSDEVRSNHSDDRSHSGGSHSYHSEEESYYSDHQSQGSFVSGQDSYVSGEDLSSTYDSFANDSGQQFGYSSHQEIQPPSMLSAHKTDDNQSDDEMDEEAGRPGESTANYQQDETEDAAPSASHRSGRSLASSTLNPEFDDQDQDPSELINPEDVPPDIESYSSQSYGSEESNYSEESGDYDNSRGRSLNLESIASTYQSHSQGRGDERANQSVGESYTSGETSGFTFAEDSNAGESSFYSSTAPSFADDADDTYESIQEGQPIALFKRENSSHSEYGSEADYSGEGAPLDASGQMSADRILGDASYNSDHDQRSVSEGSSYRSGSADYDSRGADSGNLSGQSGGSYFSDDRSSARRSVDSSQISEGDAELVSPGANGKDSNTEKPVSASPEFPSNANEGEGSVADLDASGLGGSVEELDASGLDSFNFSDNEQDDLSLGDGEEAHSIEESVEKLENAQEQLSEGEDGSKRSFRPSESRSIGKEENGIGRTSDFSGDEGSREEQYGSEYGSENEELEDSGAINQSPGAFYDERGAQDHSEEYSDDESSNEPSNHSSARAGSQEDLQSPRDGSFSGNGSVVSDQSYSSRGSIEGDDGILHSDHHDNDGDNVEPDDLSRSSHEGGLQDGVDFEGSDAERASVDSEYKEDEDIGSSGSADERLFLEDGALGENASLEGRSIEEEDGQSRGSADEDLAPEEGSLGENASLEDRNYSDKDDNSVGSADEQLSLEDESVEEDEPLEDESIGKGDSQSLGSAEEQLSLEDGSLGENASLEDGHIGKGESQSLGSAEEQLSLEDGTLGEKASLDDRNIGKGDSQSLGSSAGQLSPEDGSIGENASLGDGSIGGGDAHSEGQLSPEEGSLEDEVSLEDANDSGQENLDEDGGSLGEISGSGSLDEVDQEERDYDDFIGGDSFPSLVSHDVGEGSKIMLNDIGDEGGARDELDELDEDDLEPDVGSDVEEQSLSASEIFAQDSDSVSEGSDGEDQGEEEDSLSASELFEKSQGSIDEASGSYSEGSYVSGDGSYVSGEDSYVSGEGSYISGEGSYISGEGSYVSGEGSYVSGEGSYSDDYSDEEGLSYGAGASLAGSIARSFDGEASALESIVEVSDEDSEGNTPSDVDEASIDEDGEEEERGMPLSKHIPEQNKRNDDSKHSFGSRSDFFPDASIDGTVASDIRSLQAESDRQPGAKDFKNRDDKLGGIAEAEEESMQDPDASQADKLGDEVNETEKQEVKKKKKKRMKKKVKKNRPKVNVRSEALLDLVANVNDAMLELEEEENRSDYDADLDSSARRLLLGFEALLGILLQLSDELELVSTFAHKKDTLAIDALQAVLSFAPELDHVFDQLKPILQTYLHEEPDEEMDDLLYRLNSLMDLLVESTHRVGERHEWNPRAETAYVTLLEMLERDTLEVTCLFDDVTVPEYPLSGHLEDAWTETGHEEEFKTLDVTDDIWMFRQVCYEVLVSTDQWCPDTRVLMDICGIDPADMDEDRIPPDDYELAPVPDAAKQVLEKVHGDPLPRKSVMASILRRILPPRAITDKTLLDNFASIRNSIRNPRGLSATNLVAVSSVPESLVDPESLGVDGVGKTTLAAMVAHHPDVRRFFLDGVIWIYIGQMELNYTRYTQCLRELLAQLYLEDDEQVPMFPDLIHTPGESKSKRRRREEGFMLHVRETIADFLQYRDVLIILDDICYEADLDWFDFAPIQSENPGEEFTFALLVTTRCRYLLPAADTVEIDMLDEADAIQLLIQESGENLSQTLMAESPEARSVVRECANHPLAVKSVGRWLNLKHATAGVVSSVEEIHEDVVKSMDKILQNGDQDNADMMYEILNMSLSPAINGEPTNIIKFCFAAFVVVFCDRDHISEFALIEDFPMVPMPMAELFFESLLELEENTLLKEGSLFYAQKKEAAVLIPEALSALGVLKVIATYSEPPEDGGGETPENQGEEKYLQVMHSIQQEYGESLTKDDELLRDLTKDAEKRWNNAFAEAFLATERDWDSEDPDAALDYALEMLPSHMIRGGMYSAACDLLSNNNFVRGRLFLLGRENATRRSIKDCEHLFDVMPDLRARGKKKRDRKAIMIQCYETLGSQLDMDEDDNAPEDNRVKGVEVGRAHYDIGFSLAEKKCWEAAIAHWEKSQELLVSSIGMVEIVAAILFNVGVVYAEMNDFERSLGSLKQCLRIRGALHGEEHLLYAQTIQKIGDVFLMMSDYHEAMESYNWALDVMHIEPSLHRVDIGDIQENLGNIHYSKGEIKEALQCFQAALQSKQADLGEEHPELATIYHHIGNCLADQDNRFEAIDNLEQAIHLKEIDPDGGAERDADVLTIEGVLSSISGRQDEGLECYEKALQILVTKAPHQKEKVASLLHLIGCMYLMFGEHKKAMKLFQESLQARRKVLGFVHLDVASTLFNMSFLHSHRGRLDKALKCLEEALKIRKLRLPESEKVAITYEKIGKVAREMGKTTKAQNALEEALQIRKKVHGGLHEAVASVLQELGDLMDDLGNYKDAMDKYFEALDIRQELFGNDHVAVAETFYSMGYTLQNQDSPDQALDCFEESLNIRKVRLGPDAKEVGDTLNMMGFLQAKRGELDDALSLLWDALRIRKLHDDHVKVSETLKNIGNVHREKQEHELAIECYEECLRIRRSELGDGHEKVADALIAMGNVQSDMEMAEEAMRSYREALTIRTLIFGEHDDSVGAVLQKMGSLEFQNGEYEKALSMLTEFIRIRQENDSENDGDYVNVLFMIGNIHKMQGNEEEAKKWWTDAYDVFQELGLSEGNPQVAKVMDNLLREENIGQRDIDLTKKQGLFGKMADKVKDTLRDDRILGKLRPAKKKAGQRLGGAPY